MKRRGHRKSRHGCQECKRRHIKCDEGRPQCANCTITSRHCDFGDRRRSTRHGAAAAAAAAVESSAAAASPQPRPRTPSALAGEEDNEEGASPHVVPQEVNDNTQQQQAASASDAGVVVNLDHMELMAHYTFAVSNPEINPDLDRAATKMVVQTALAFPWLLHEILAISSRHLAVVAVRPGRAAFYRAQASQLQTQALHLFNRRGGNGGGSIDETNCAAAVLFSSTLGRHLLADMLDDLHHPDDDDSGSSSSEAALDRYCGYLQVHLGLRAVASSSWSHLMESDLWPLIALAGCIHTSRSSVRGTELRDLSRWVRGEEAAFRGTMAVVATGNDGGDDDEEGEEEKEEECRKACVEAIDLLQIGLDESSSAGGTSARFYPCRFSELIRRRSPPALVILAHYAVLLHWSRGLWQIGPSAPRFLQVISDVLGPGYDALLAWPRAVVLGGGWGRGRHP
ncbi:hypothetical protein PG994_003171 [Apiospora phragmitis]|uniref:Zn(2)-C6 fungal-type domain-containing protein n=1 Tax=Apiospora phragmitis TaxID=2905665 RepID=A0ABR1VXE5_9PEZI